MGDRDIEYDAFTRIPEEMSVRRLMEVVRHLREHIYQLNLRHQPVPDWAKCSHGNLLALRCEECE
jgi:hypothetical protein